LGLIDGDKEFIDGITENGELGSGHQSRWLFVHLLTTRTMMSPDKVWDATWQLLSDGILFVLILGTCIYLDLGVVKHAFGSTSTSVHGMSRFSVGWINK
jgi:hypothetical protein